MGLILVGVLPVAGVLTPYRHLAAPVAAFCEPGAEVGQQLVAREDIPKGLDPRVGEVAPAVASEGVGGVGEALACGKGDYGGVDELYRKEP